MDDDDDGPRPGKRSCTMKTTVSPQPSPTLIECPEPGCDKKYKHINGLRYHQAHAHLEEVCRTKGTVMNKSVIIMCKFVFLNAEGDDIGLCSHYLMNWEELKSLRAICFYQAT